MRKISDLGIGEKVRFGAYSVNGETPHKLRWIKASSSNAFITEYIEDMIAFDAQEKGNISRYRNMHGSNRYSVSNERQFLNSCEDAWFRKMTGTDEPPTEKRVSGPACAHKPGFLRHFEPWEIDCIDTTEVVTALSRIDKGDGSGVDRDVTYDLVFLPSRTNIRGYAIKGIFEGGQWEYFSDHDATGHVSDECLADVAHFGLLDEDGDRSYAYNLRTPQTDIDCGIRIIDSYGELDGSEADRGYNGLRPALRISPDTLVSDEKDEDGYYVVIKGNVTMEEVNEEDFWTILNQN